MATLEQFDNVFKEECVFVDYLPINLREEEVISVTQDNGSLSVVVNDISVTVPEDVPEKPSENVCDLVANEVCVKSLVEVTAVTEDVPEKPSESVCDLVDNEVCVKSLVEITVVTEDVPKKPSESVCDLVDNEVCVKSEVELTAVAAVSEAAHTHSKQVVDELPTKPPESEKGGSKAATVQKQLKTHSCFHCSRMFITHEKMLRHVRMYHKENVQVQIDSDGKRCWVCGSCNKTFISRKGSIIHQRTHTGERPYPCMVCSKRFIDSSTLMKHQVIHQATRPFTCHICKRGFNQKVALQRHERTHSQQQVVYICKYCPKTFLVTSSLQAHEKIHSGIKPFSCSYCPSSFHTSTAQRQHERVHTNERPYRCLYCPKAFKDSGTLFKHQVIHSGIKPFVCPLCSQGFTQKVALKKHIKSHVSRSNVKSCEICKNLTFETKDELYEHFEKHVEDHPKLLEVRNVASSSTKNTKYAPLTESDLSDLTTLCDVAISAARNLTFNGADSDLNGYNKCTDKNDVDEDEYSCSECGLGFKRLKSLKAHLLGHSPMCKKCGKVYSDRTLLEEHERLFCNHVSVTNHSSKLNRKRLTKLKPSVKLKSTIGKRQFFCEKCDKYFSSRNGYMIHQRSHTGERPYACRWCEKAFGDSATRHKHERIHTGERPFKCVQCPRAFNQRAALRAHQITHSVDRAYVCPFCPSSFPYAATLKRHCDTCHNDNSEILCPVCKKFLPNTETLHYHIISVHIVDGKPCVCPMCDSGIFTNADEFADHVVWHAKQVIPNNNNSNKLINKNNRDSKRTISNTLRD